MNVRNLLICTYSTDQLNDWSITPSNSFTTRKSLFSEVESTKNSYKNNLFTMIMEVYLVLLVMNMQKKKKVIFAVNDSSSRQF